jgi:hypothetical protein
VLLAYLPDEISLQRLRRACDRSSAGLRFTLRVVPDWGEMLSEAGRSAPETAVFDPYVGENSDFFRPAAFHEHFPAVVLLAYADFRGRSPRDTVRLLHSGVREVVARDTDDDPIHWG